MSTKRTGDEGGAKGPASKKAKRDGGEPDGADQQGLGSGAGSPTGAAAAAPGNAAAAAAAAASTLDLSTFTTSDDLPDSAQVKAALEAGTPFPHAAVRPFLSETFAHAIKDELMAEDGLEYYEKANDLYDLFQTDDLKDIPALGPPFDASVDAGGGSDTHTAPQLPALARLREVLYSDEVLAYVEAVTGIRVNKTADMHGIIFRKTGQLLCHDDHLEGRRVAYILYFVDEAWSADDGGALDLFDTDAAGYPTGIATSLVPAWNTLALFPVSSVSFHQVAEVVSDDKIRLSISGWFYGEPIEWSPLPLLGVFSEEAMVTPAAVDGPEAAAGGAGLLQEWLAEQYLDPQVQDQIKGAFVDESNIDLVDFLVLEKYEEIVRYLKDSPAAMRRWNLRGPALQWNYLEWSGEGPGAGEEDTAPSPIDGLVALLVSAPFVEWLSAVTGLSLVKAHAEARRFSRHHYTLLFDGAPCYEGLDAFLNLSPGDWDPEAGGVTSYVYDKEHLASIVPAGNKLSLIFCDQGVYRYTKFVNCLAEQDRIDVACVYMEPPEARGEDGGASDGDSQSGGDGGDAAS